MRRRFTNPGVRLSVDDRVQLIRRASEGESVKDLSAAYDVSVSQVQRILNKAGFKLSHGGARVGAGQTGKGARLAMERAEETPEMLWLDAMLGLWAMAASDEQWQNAQLRAGVRVKKKRPPPTDRLQQVSVIFGRFYPRLEGKRVEGRDLGRDVEQFAKSAVAAIAAHMPIEDPVDEETMEAFQKAAVEVQMAPGARRPSECPRVEPPSLWRPEPETVAGIVPPVPEVLADMTPEEQEDFLKVWARRQRERAAGVVHITPKQYERIRKLEQEVQEEMTRRRAAQAMEYARAEMRAMVGRRPPARPRSRWGNPDTKRWRLQLARDALAIRQLLRPKRPARKRSRKTKANGKPEGRAILRRLLRL